MTEDSRGERPFANVVLQNHANRETQRVNVVGPVQSTAKPVQVAPLPKGVWRLVVLLGIEVWTRTRGFRETLRRLGAMGLPERVRALRTPPHCPRSLPCTPSDLSLPDSSLDRTAPYRPQAARDCRWTRS